MSTLKEGVRRLGVYGTLSKEPPDYLRIEDIEHQEVTITGVEFTRGDYGEYAMFTIATPEGERKVRSGAKLVVDALKDAQAQEAFPVVAFFKKHGRTWRIE